VEALLGLGVVLAVLTVWPPRSHDSADVHVWLLPFGWFCAAAACVAGDYVAMWMEGVHKAGVNWVTIYANTVAVVLGRLLLQFEGWPATAASPRLAASLARFHGTFVGALSAYGAFVEDVSSPMFHGHWKFTLRNWGWNVLVSVYLQLLCRIGSQL